MRWEWKWDERYLTRTRRGERKRRGKEQTHTPTHLARSGQTLKGQGEKKKAEGRRTRTKTSGGGGRRKRLNQPAKAKTYKNLSTRRSQLTWGGRRAWDRGPMGISWWNHKKLNQDSVPRPRIRAIVPQQARVQVSHKGMKRLSSSIELGAQYVSPHQKPKRPHLQEKDMPVAFICSCHVSCQKLKLQRKRGFWWLRPHSLWKKGKMARNPGTKGPAGYLEKAEKPQGHLLHFT